MSNPSPALALRPWGVALAAALGYVLPLTVSAANPTWLGRPFVRVLGKGDPIPGAPGTKFGYIENFTLRDGRVHVVAGETASRKGLFRWREGTLTRLVYTDTLSPTGSTFDNVHFTTDETEGALNFVGEVNFGRPGAVYGLFEWKDGVITLLLDTATEVAGKTPMGFGYPVRVGHRVVFNSQYFEAGAIKNGIFLRDGAALRTIIKTGDDLPGSLGGFTGQPGRYQISFDGENVGFVAAADPQGKGPYGIYRAAPDGTVTKLIDGNDKYPDPVGASTYFQQGFQFVNVEVDGPLSFLGVGEMVSASGGGRNSFYGLGARFTGGTLNVATATFGTDGTYEEVLPYVEADGITRTKLDGQEWTNIQWVDGQGDDVALLVRLADGTQAIYAAVGATTVTPTAVTLGQVSYISGGPLSFTFPTQAGVTYVVETQAILGSPEWTPLQTIVGDGATKKIEAAVAGGAGFIRVRVK